MAKTMSIAMEREKYGTLNTASIVSLEETNDLHQSLDDAKNRKIWENEIFKSIVCWLSNTRVEDNY